MQLSARLFADIVGEETAANVSSASVDERRQSVRASLGRRARIIPLMKTSSDQGQVVLVRDISVHGIGMLVAEAMTPGDEFIIELPLPIPTSPAASSTEQPVQIHCAVRRCQAGGSGQTQFLVGSTFELVLNRALDYAVEFPKEASDDQQQESPESSTADSWDTLTLSPSEGRFDKQMAEAMANRPQRRSAAELLEQYRLTRWLVERLRRCLMPLIAAIRRLGIRNRLSRNFGGDSGKVELDVDGSSAVNSSPESAVPFRERRLINALDSASHYSPNSNVEPEMPAMAYSSAATSGRRPSLFVHDQPTPVSATIETQSVAEPLPNDSSAIAQPAAEAPPVTVPAFELPEVLPLDIPIASHGLSHGLSHNATPPTESAPVLDAPAILLQSNLSTPDGLRPKPHSGAAWRGRHRLGWHESPRNRPKLGR